MDFGNALYRLRLGERVRRRGWEGHGTHLELRGPELHRGVSKPMIYVVSPNPDAEKVKEREARGMVGADMVWQPWSVSQADILAEDWEVC